MTKLRMTKFHRPRHLVCHTGKLGWVDEKKNECKKRYQKIKVDPLNLKQGNQRDDCTPKLKIKK